METSSHATGKILAVSKNYSYNAVTHTVSLASGIAVVPDGNVLAFTSKGGLAATLDMLNGGASSDVSMSATMGLSLYNDRVASLTDLLGKGKTVATGFSFKEVIALSMTAELSTDNQVVGTTFQIGLGFGASPIPAVL